MGERDEEMEKGEAATAKREEGLLGDGGDEFVVNEQKGRGGGKGLCIEGCGGRGLVWE